MSDVPKPLKRKSRFDTDTTDAGGDVASKKLATEASIAAARAAEISREIANKMSMMSSLASTTASNNAASNELSERKLAYKPLLLDAQGNEAVCNLSQY